MAKKKSGGKKKAASKPAASAAPPAEPESARVRAANAERDLLAAFAAFSTFNRHGGPSAIQLTSFHAGDLCAADRDEIAALFELNMRAQYEASDWGVDAAAKREELFEPAARYIVARDSMTNELAGFAHFRFVVDDGADVLYVFELQVAPALQRRGLGKFLMQLLLLVARRADMELVVLTVFKTNHAALAFYRTKLGFEVDETSPSACGDSSQSYEILSRAVTKPSK